MYVVVALESIKKSSQVDTKSQGVYPIKATIISIHDIFKNVNINDSYAHIMTGTVGLEDANGKIEYYAVRSVIEERVKVENYK